MAIGGHNKQRLSKSSAVSYVDFSSEPASRLSAGRSANCVTAARFKSSSCSSRSSSSLLAPALQLAAKEGEEGLLSAGSSCQQLRLALMHQGNVTHQAASNNDHIGQQESTARAVNQQQPSASQVAGLVRGKQQVVSSNTTSSNHRCSRAANQQVGIQVTSSHNRVLGARLSSVVKAPLSSSKRHSPQSVPILLGRESSSPAPTASSAATNSRLRQGALFARRQCNISASFSNAGTTPTISSQPLSRVSQVRSSHQVLQQVARSCKQLHRNSASVSSLSSSSSSLSLVHVKRPKQAAIVGQQRSYQQAVSGRFAASRIKSDCAIAFNRSRSQIQSTSNRQTPVGPSAIVKPACSQLRQRSSETTSHRSSAVCRRKAPGVVATASTTADERRAPTVAAANTNRTRTGQTIITSNIDNAANYQPGQGYNILNQPALNSAPLLSQPTESTPTRSVVRRTIPETRKPPCRELSADKTIRRDKENLQFNRTNPSRPSDIRFPTNSSQQPKKTMISKSNPTSVSYLAAPADKRITTMIQHKGPLGLHQSTNVDNGTPEVSQASVNRSRRSSVNSQAFSATNMTQELNQVENLPPELSENKHNNNIIRDDKDVRKNSSLNEVTDGPASDCFETRSEADSTASSSRKTMDYHDDSSDDEAKKISSISMDRSNSLGSNLDDQMILGSPLDTPPPSELELDDLDELEAKAEQTDINKAELNIALDIPIKSEPISDYYDLEARPFARGKFAQVKRCIHKTTKQCFAAKCIKKRRRLVDIRHEILLEIEALKLSYYTERIVKLYEVYETPNEMILVLEMAKGGELQRVLDEEEVIDEVIVKRMVDQILEGLVQLHDNNIAHLDIKPQNLLLTELFPDGNILLCDFGISRRITKDCEIREICGTPDYVAPEILRYDPISLATDMWSLGVLTYVLLTGYSPFGSENKQQTFCNITQATLDFPSEIFDKISKEALDFMKNLMLQEPSRRLTSRQARKHPWLVGQAS